MDKNKLTLELPEQYQDLVDTIKDEEICTISDCIFENRSEVIDDELEALGFDGNEENLVIKIFLADEIIFDKTEYLWSIKGVENSTLGVSDGGELTTGIIANPLSYSYMKKVLNDSDSNLTMGNLEGEEVQ